MRRLLEKLVWMALLFREHAKDAIRRLWMWFVATPPETTEAATILPLAPPAPPIQLIRVRSPFRSKHAVRTVRLLGRSGFHAVAQSEDDGPQTVLLVSRGTVEPEFAGDFDRFMATN